MLKAKNLLPALFLALLVVTLIPMDSFGQSAKMAIVRDDEIKQKYPAWTRAEEQFITERNAWDEEAVAMQTELQELVDEYERQRLILSEEKRNEREAQIRTKNEALDAFTRQIYGPGGSAEKKQEELFAPLLEAVTKAIEAVALEDGLDVVFTMQSGLGYIREDLDVTDKVLDALDKLE